MAVTWLKCRREGAVVDAGGGIVRDGACVVDDDAETGGCRRVESEVEGSAGIVDTEFERRGRETTSGAGRFDVLAVSKDVGEIERVRFRGTTGRGTPNVPLVVDTGGGGIELPFFDRSDGETAQSRVRARCGLCSARRCCKCAR